MSSNTVVEGKDTVKFVDEEGINQAVDTIEEKSKETEQEEDERSAAFNPETGEINWDCPCLGGMAQGPCGEDFKAAFSCFVYSEAEPKGLDCVEKFKAMQDCFRRHPDVYGDEIDDDDDEQEDENVEKKEQEETSSVQEDEEVSASSPYEPPLFTSVSSWVSSWF